MFNNFQTGRWPWDIADGLHILQWEQDQQDTGGWIHHPHHHEIQGASLPRGQYTIIKYREPHFLNISTPSFYKIKRAAIPKGRYTIIKNKEHLFLEVTSLWVNELIRKGYTWFLITYNISTQANFFHLVTCVKKCHVCMSTLFCDGR